MLCFFISASKQTICSSYDACAYLREQYQHRLNSYTILLILSLRILKNDTKSLCGEFISFMVLWKCEVQNKH